MINKDFDAYAIDVDTYCVQHDIDDYDLFAEKIDDDNQDSYGDDLILS